MRRPWQVWLWFVLCLSVVVPAMAWLTLLALRLDQDVANASQQAALEEDISLTLWRMDAVLAPLVAQEAARPFVVYRPFLEQPHREASKAATVAKASPLLVQPSELVRLHFQLSPDGKLTSPQAPDDALWGAAVEQGASQDAIALSCNLLSELNAKINRNELLACVPQESLPELAQGLPEQTSQVENWAGPRETSGILQNDQQVVDVYANSPPQQQLDTQAPQTSLANPPNQPFDVQAAEVQQRAAAPQSKSTTLWNEQLTKNFYAYSRTPDEQAERGNLEYARRNRALQTYANAEVVKQRQNLPELPPQPSVNEGVSTPLWVGSELMLARRVKVGDEVYLQGCWFDWPKLKSLLIAEGTLAAGGEMPGSLSSFDLRPISVGAIVAPARRLATLPVEIVVPPLAAAQTNWSPIRLSLWIAWACLLLATAAVALLLQGVITLSERRGAFVSAVTHELRTPLTTFRMYAEMLAEGMVKEEARQKDYCHTLRVEADRLSHLVENVLSYARLERGRKHGRKHPVEVAEILERTSRRLAERAQQAQMNLCIAAEPSVRAQVVETDAAAVEQILFNLVDNACKYAASSEVRDVHLEITASAKEVTFRVRDHGPGISQQFRKRLFQPFSKSVEDAAVSAPGVGLGLALCRRLSVEIGGRLELQHSTSNGACFALILPLR